MWIPGDILILSESQEIEMVYLLNGTIIYCNTKVSNYFWMFKNIINLEFSTLSSSIFDFNQVVIFDIFDIFDISVLILFSMFMFFVNGCRRFQVLT